MADTKGLTDEMLVAMRAKYDQRLATAREAFIAMPQTGLATLLGIMCAPSAVLKKLPDAINEIIFDLAWIGFVQVSMSVRAIEDEGKQP